ncbi:MAG: phenylalanine--tRNA ligase subunit beta [Candidatus Kryptonium sp.]|nr:phenylalanine--tRNA ligase subunit beta [Candidatus Kryptonium sp.]MDW8108633.1 phenylalanine--tRNA ligase subunit beta [Candidatus Kryptonium sp.]
MKISHKWLKNYIELEANPEEVKEKLTMLGLEVESVEYLGEKFKGFYVGEVLEVNKHPNADKLTVCKVNVGNDTLQIICGAPNVATGQKVPVALVGAIIPRNQHDPEGKPFVLTRAKIRGVESFGMICSEYELGLGDDKEGIMVLDPNAKVGQPLAEYFGLDDVVYDISITPNRPDCLSHIGIARELAVAFGLKLKKPEIKIIESNRKITDFASVEIIDSVNCPRYAARVVFNVKVEPSPKWLQNYLQSVGLRPINNIVDITNFVLYEIGHPLHAFDYDKLAGHKIIVKCANEGETFITLDGKARTLRKDTLMICDAEKPVAIAGVMGGANTEITSETKNVLIESAYFNPISIRRTSKYLGLSTDASYRFERGADPEAVIWAVNRAAQLMAEIAGGEVLQGIIDVYPVKIETKIVTLRFARLNSVLGVDVHKNEVAKILEGLEFEILNQDEERLTVKIPTFRPDIEREIDLIEEVARVYGYDKIPDKMQSVIHFSDKKIKVDFHEIVRERLIGAGFKEVVTNSMLDENKTALFGKNFVKVLNPLSKEMSTLRTSLIPSALDVVKHNFGYGIKNLKFFEIGKVYRIAFDEDEKPRYVDNYVEEERLLILITGLAEPISHDIKERNFDIYDLKGEVERLFRSIFLENYQFIYYSNNSGLADLEIGVEIAGKYAGRLIKVSDEILEKFDIESDIYIAEVDFDLLCKHSKIEERRYSELPRFPSVYRDLAFVVDEEVPVGEIEKAIKEKIGETLRSIRLFDIYRGEKIGEGKKSVAFSLEILSREKTLTDEEVNELINKVVNYISQKFGAQLRTY